MKFEKKKFLNNIKEKVREDICIDKTTHGFKVTSDYGNKFENFCSNFEEALQFAKQEFGLDLRNLKNE